jgi:hypothetical protein
MKKILILGCCGWLALAGRAAESFVRQLTTEERHAAGLDQLTPAQQQALDALATRFASEGARVTEARVREETKAEVVQARAEAKVQAEAEAKQREAKKIGLEPDKESEMIKTRISGPFNGWRGRTLFKLENGQQWVQTDGEVYAVPVVPGPEVEIVHSGFGGWKLAILPGGRWVRVKRVN